MDTITLDFWQKLATTLSSMGCKQGQILALLHAFREVEPEKMQEFIESGVLTDLALLDPRALDLFALKRVKARPFANAKIVVRSGSTLGHDSIFRLVCEKGIRLTPYTMNGLRQFSLPCTPEGVMVVEVKAEKLVGVKKYAYSLEEIFSAAKKKGLCLLDPVTGLFAVMEIQDLDCYLASDLVRIEYSSWFKRYQDWCLLRISNSTFLSEVTWQSVSSNKVEEYYRGTSKWLFGIPEMH